MSNIIRHKRSNNLGASPALNTFTEGEILLNTRDGKAFFKKVMPGSEELVELRGTRDDVRATGQTGLEVVSETGIRAAISSVVQDLIPNYFVTNRIQFLDAYNDIRQNYPGGNIYVTDDIIMTANMTLDLSGINIYGHGCNWRFYDGSELNPSQVYKIIITNGSPTFTGINFWGSNGSSSLQLQNGTTRQVITISTQLSSVSKFITFRDCRFSDIVCGTPGNPIIVDSPIGANATINFAFDGCNVNTHGTNTALTGFGVQYTSSSPSGLISIDVRGQIPSLQSHQSLKYKVNRDYADKVVFAFNSDETAWIDSDSDLANISRTNTVLQAVPVPAVFTPSESYLLMSTGQGDNITRVSAAALVSGGGGSGLGSVGLSMPNIFSVSNSPLTSDGTISVALKQQAASMFLASPASTIGTPSFRAITADDIPALPYDNYGYFSAGITGALVRVDGYNYTPGSTFKGISFYGGSNISLTQTAWSDGTLLIGISASATGGLTSVGLSMPNIFTVGNNPLIANGTLSVSLASQTQNKVLASPSGGTGTPTFRALVRQDIPDLSSLYDRYLGFDFGIENLDNQIVGRNGLYIAGSSYKGISLIPGNNITLSRSDDSVNGALKITINSTASSSGGGLTSVGLSMPNIFSVSNSPLTANGTIGVSLVSQIKNKVLASPDNSNGVPYFRMLTEKDIPALPYDNFGTLSVNGSAIIGSEGIYQQGTNYSGISIEGGTGITVNSSSGTHQELVLTINSTGGGSGGTENTINTATLVSDSASLSSGTWTTVLELSITEVGTYFLNFHVSAAKVSSGSATVAARLLVNGSTVIGSVETYTSAYRAALSGHGYTIFGIGRETIVALQVYVNSTSWVAKATTSTSGSSNATQLTSIKIS